MIALRIAKFVLLVATLALTGCATSGTSKLPDTQVELETGNDPRAAHVIDTMSIRKEMPNRPAEKWEFFFKHCSRGDAERHVYYSKTSYFCSGPY